MWTTLTEMAELLLPYITSTRRGIHRCHIVCTWTADCIAFVYVEFEVNSFCHSIDRNGPKFYTTLFLFLFSFPKYNVCYGQVIYQMWGICCSVPLEECDCLLLANMYHDLGLMFYCAPLSVCLSRRLAGHVTDTRTTPCKMGHSYRRRYSQSISFLAGIDKTEATCNIISEHKHGLTEKYTET